MKHRRDNQERKIQRYRQYGHKKQNKDIKQTQHRKQQKDEQHRPHQKYTMSNPRKVLSVTEERIYKNGKDPFSCEKRLLPQQCNRVSGNSISYIQSNVRNGFYHNNVTLCLVTLLAIYSQTFPCGHLY